MNWKGKGDGPYLKYVTFDVQQYLWSFIQIFHIVNELQVKNHFSDQSRVDNSWTGKVRVKILSHNM